MIIGSFVSNDAGYSGTLKCLSVCADLAIIPAAPTDTENAPDWRIICGDGDAAVEVGAGWSRTGKRAGKFIAVQIDDPFLARPIRANLVHTAHDEHTHHLLWSRPSPRDKK